MVLFKGDMVNTLLEVKLLDRNVSFAPQLLFDLSLAKFVVKFTDDFCLHVNLFLLLRKESPV